MYRLLHSLQQYYREKYLQSIKNFNHNLIQIVYLIINLHKLIGQKIQQLSLLNKLILMIKINLSNKDHFNNIIRSGLMLMKSINPLINKKDIENNNDKCYV